MYAIRMKSPSELAHKLKRQSSGSAPLRVKNVCSVVARTEQMQMSGRSVSRSVGRGRGWWLVVSDLDAVKRHVEQCRNVRVGEVSLQNID